MQNIWQISSLSWIDNVRLRATKCRDQLLRNTLEQVGWGKWKKDGESSVAVISISQAERFDLSTSTCTNEKKPAWRLLMKEKVVSSTRDILAHLRFHDVISSPTSSSLSFPNFSLCSARLSNLQPIDWLNFVLSLFKQN